MNQLTASPATKSAWPVRILRGLAWVIWTLIKLLAVLWATLVIHYSNLPWPWARTALAVAFAGFSVWALWLNRTPRIRWTFVALFAGVIAWYASIPPSHDRPWRPEVAVMPRAFIDGDRVRFTGFRNFNFRSRDDFDIRYEERAVSIDHLTDVDLYISYWMPGPVAHTFVSFRFDNAPPICISIETRPEVGEGFAPVASMFKQFELIYVVGEERDLVRVRTNYRDEEVFLYPIRMSTDKARELFRIYCDRINELADTPEFYHLLKNSCTVNIVRYANAAGRVGSVDIRHYLNGWIDRYLYSVGAIDTSLPFEELRRRSDITATSKQAKDDADYWTVIRAGLPPVP
jgi:hypothetical protein